MDQSGVKQRRDPLPLFLCRIYAGRKACFPEIHALAAHRHALSEQPLSLLRPFRQTPVRPDDAMPRKVVDRGQNVPDQSRRMGIDIAVGAHEPPGDRTYPLDDARRARLATPPIDTSRLR